MHFLSELFIRFTFRFWFLIFIRSLPASSFLPFIFGYCKHAVNLHPNHSCFSETDSVQRKPKAIPSILRFFYCGNPEHTERTRSRRTTGNVFPCDVTVNKFSAKGINLLTLAGFILHTVYLFRNIQFPIIPKRHDGKLFLITGIVNDNDVIDLNI